MLNQELKEKAKIEDIPKNWKPVAEYIGLDNFFMLVEYLGGGQCYLPRVEKIYLKIRNRIIRERYNGHNGMELAKEFKLTYNGLKFIVEVK